MAGRIVAALALSFLVLVGYAQDGSSPFRKGQPKQESGGGNYKPAGKNDSPFGKDDGPSMPPGISGGDDGEVPAAPPPKPPEEVHKGLPYKSQLDKALEYCAKEKNVGYGVVPATFAGLAFMLDGREEYKDDFESVVQQAMRGYKNEKAYNHNWFTAYCGLFLSIVYYRDPRPEIKAALEDIIEVAGRNVEETGGWCHHLGMWKGGYNKRGGGKDLGIVTAIMVSAFMIMKQCEIKVPDALLSNALANLNKLSRGGGIAYGTDNGVGDRAMSRASSAYIGCHVARYMSPGFVKGAARAAAQSQKRAESAHAYGPVHFFALAVALHQMGKFASMGNYWLPKLAAQQTAEGTVKMLNDGKTDGEKNFTKHRVGSTGVFALMILLQKYKLFPKQPKIKQDREAERKKQDGIQPAGGGSSPFKKKLETPSGKK